jgi:hypothetical protein
LAGGGEGGGGLSELVAPRTNRKRVYAPFRPRAQMSSEQRENNDALLSSRPSLRF